MQDARNAFHTAGSQPRTAANRFGVDYRIEASRLAPPPVPIFDFHTHVNGKAAAPIWRDVASMFGVTKALTMVRLEEAPAVRAVLGDMVEFIAFPNFRHADRGYAFREGFLDDIKRFREEYGSRIIKLWNAPRVREFFSPSDAADLFEFDGAWRVKPVELALKLGMDVMVHVADPDTWFATKYADAAKYGTKLSYYRGLEVMLDRYPQQRWIAAHMGGYAEKLDFLDQLLERHQNLFLDTSATKWVVRELSRHPTERVVRFFTQWRGRMLFGSDIVTTDEHLAPKQAQAASPMADLADSPQSAFDLYSSRYLALRLLLESSYRGESPIADPDLAMVDPARYDALSAPELRGAALPQAVLADLYQNTANSILRRG